MAILFLVMKDGLPVILCIGSDKISGDSIGPAVGSYLKFLNVPCFVYGAEGESVNGINLQEFLDHIKKVHSNSTIFAVDACISQCKKDDEVLISLGGVSPKRALTKQKRMVGDIGILGLIFGTDDNHLATLLATPNDNVHKIAVKIAFLLYKALFCA